MHDFVKPGKMNILMDGQFGSTGKGAAAAYIAMFNEIDIAVTNAAPNAGHTYDIGAGKRTVFHLPVSGVLKQDATIFIGPGAIIDPEVLEKELIDFGIDSSRVFIHPGAAIIEPRDKEAEAAGSSTARIASTQKGVGAALARKIRREGNVAGNVKNLNIRAGWMREMVSEFSLMAAINRGNRALMEVPQGYSLGLDAGFYPHCTSRNISVAQALSDAGVHPHFLGNVLLSLRTFPIRVGHLIMDGVKVGDSGPVYTDQKELSWTDDLAMAPELTTVTKRPRRIFSFSYDQYTAACQYNRPSHLFLNFCNYLTCNEELQVMLRQLLELGRLNCGQTPEYILGFGPSIFDVYTSDQYSAFVAAERGALPWRCAALPHRA